MACSPAGSASTAAQLRDHADQVRRVIRALLQAHRYLRENPEGTQQVMMNWLKIDEEMAADIYQMAINNYTRNGMVEEAMLNSLVGPCSPTPESKARLRASSPISRCCNRR